MPPVGAPAVCLLASVISVGPAFFSLAFFLVFPGLLSSVCVCVCVCVCQGYVMVRKIFFRYDFIDHFAILVCFAIF